jgi:ribose transport system substrate-binding protein
MLINSAEEILVKNPGPRQASRFLAVAAVVLAGVTTLVACGSAAPKTTAADTKVLKMGFSPLSLDDAPLLATANGLRGAAKASGKFQVAVADPKGDVATQVNQLEQWIQLRTVNAIWVIPISPAAIVPVIKQAQAAKIPMIVDSLPSQANMTTGAPGVSFSSISYTVYGQAVGQLIGKCVSQRLGGTAQIIFLRDSTGQVSGAAADTALLAAVHAAAPGSTIVRTISPTSQLAAQQDTLSALQGAPNSNAALTLNDESALGSLSAFRQAGKDPKKVCIVGGGGGAESLAAVKAGTLYGEVAFDFKTDTQQNITELGTMLGNPTGPGKLLTVPVTVQGPTQ